jgi:hypothetical protein
MKRGKPKPRSDERVKEESQYSQDAKEYKAEHPWCEACGIVPGTRGGHGRRATNDIHHKAGREHGLLLKKEYWLASCNFCHAWITNHAKLAFELGLRIRLPTDLGLPGMDPTPRVFH